ncbi:hypothetical protein VPH35_005375 [Triticum aestivum]
METNDAVPLPNHLSLHPQRSTSDCRRLRHHRIRDVLTLLACSSKLHWIHAQKQNKKLHWIQGLEGETGNECCSLADVGSYIDNSTSSHMPIFRCFSPCIDCFSVIFW